MTHGNWDKPAQSWYLQPKQHHVVTDGLSSTHLDPAK